MKGRESSGSERLVPENVAAVQEPKLKQPAKTSPNSEKVSLNSFRTWIN
jgi:hypothetical protein